MSKIKADVLHDLSSAKEIGIEKLVDDNALLLTDVDQLQVDTAGLVAEVDQLQVDTAGLMVKADQSIRVLGAYAAGLQFTSYNQAFRYLEDVYTPDASLTLPYTTTGSGAVEIANFRSIGDIELRQDLTDAAGITKGAGQIGFNSSLSYPVNTAGARFNDISNSSDPAKGAALIGRASQVVNSIVSLRALLKTVISKFAFVTGYYAAGDGGGGQYYLDAADTTSADNGGTIIVATDGGRWKLQSSLKWVSAKQFGAKVDGVTNDVTFIANALATGLDVYIPRGTTVIASGLTISLGNSLFGDGQTATVIQVNGNGYDAITISANYSGVRDLSFNATAARTSNAYVKFSAATRGNFVRRVKITNAFFGIHIADEAVITYIEDIEIVNTKPTTGIGIFIAGGNDTYLTRVVMDAPVGSQPLCGVRLKRTQAVFMVDCDMIHQGRGIQIDPESVFDIITWCFFVNVACDLGTGDGLYVNPTGGSTVKGLFFDNCWFSSNLNGINLIETGANAIDAVFFNDCTMFNNNQHGAWSQLASNVEFNNCRISGNSQSAAGSYYGILIANNSVGFAVRGTRSGPIAGFGNTQGYGLLIGSGCDQYVVTDNNFTGNTIKGVFDFSSNSSGTREVRGNLNYKTFASGVATIVNGTNSISVAHGLFDAPSVVLVTPSNTNLGGRDLWTGTFGPTTFDINVSSNVTADALFSWTASAYN